MASMAASSSAVLSLSTRERLYTKVHGRGPLVLSARMRCGFAQRSSSVWRVSAKLSSPREEGAILNASVPRLEDQEEEYVLPKLPHEEPDFWHGPQWDLLGFIVQYLWAIGIAVALVASGIAAVTYNFGASDFKETEVYKEATKSRKVSKESPGASEEASQDAPPPLDEDMT